MPGFQSRLLPKSVPFASLAVVCPSSPVRHINLRLVNPTFRLIPRSLVSFGSHNGGKTMRFRRAVSIVALLVVPVVAFGQGFQGGLRGAVRDAAGAVVPGVEIMLVNE